MSADKDVASDPLVPGAAPAEKKDYVFIDTLDDLQAWVAESSAALDRCGDYRCCLDTEADSLHHFREKLCLLQVAIAGRFALVDPLAIQDVSCLLELLDRCEVWFHGADYDLTMLLRTYGWKPRQVRDTQIAARLLGQRQFGLAALVKEFFGPELSKASQKADWSRRPLTPVMLAYAVDDVRYLLPLADRFVKSLKEQNREHWFLTSCADLQQDVNDRLNEPREDPWRVQGSGRLHPKGLALLQAAWKWREGVADEKDLPCFRVMSNKQMLAYAEQFEAGGPVSPPAGWRPRWKREFIQIVEDVVNGDPTTFPVRIKKQRGRFTDVERDQVDKLCAHRDKIAAGLNIESSLLGSRATLEQVVAAGAATEEFLLEWQSELLSEALEEIRAANKARAAVS
ncbi:MAG: HRDC domain-containing protein [Verrucomicrobiales bacterium]|nr:HRDC domain-containing protein [Verrucomicrobiales bacterium]MCP5560222.1 HRDC domain-containing protein [Verrucomicrobiaceae bacterium]